jgi:hypothetical protein
MARALARKTKFIQNPFGSQIKISANITKEKPALPARTIP